MQLTIKTLLLLLAVFVLALSAIIRPQERVDLFKLGWALAIASLVAA